MAFVNTSINRLFGPVPDFPEDFGFPLPTEVLDTFGRVVGGLASILRPSAVEAVPTTPTQTQTISFPTLGGPQVAALPGGAPAPSLGGNGTAATLNACAALMSPFTNSPCPSAKMFVMANPRTGSPMWFKPAGKPVLMTSDFASARKVRKVAAKARRARGGR